MPLIKYTPQFTEKQYIPTTDIGLVSNLINQRQAEYDKALDVQQQALSEAYGMKSTKGFESARDKFAQSIGSNIEAEIAKRGGDAGAALRSIQSAIIAAKKDPFIRANQFMLKQAEMFDQDYAKNRNALIVRNPYEVQYDPNMSEEDMRYNLLDPEEVRKMAQVDYAGEAGKRFVGIGTDPSGMYDVAKFKYGPSEERVRQILNDPKSIERLKQYYPQAAKLSPEKADGFFRNVLESSLRSMQKPEDVDVLGKNSEYEYGLKGQLKGYGKDEQAEFPLFNPNGFSQQPSDFDEGYLSNQKAIDSQIEQLAKANGLAGVSNLSDLDGIISKGVPIGGEDLMINPYIDFKNERLAKAEGIKNSIKTQVLKERRFANPSFNLNDMASADPRNITENEKIIKQFNKRVISPASSDRYEFMNKNDEKLYNSIKEKDKIEVSNIVPIIGKSAKSSLILELAGTDDDNNPIKFRKYLKRDPKVGYMQDPEERQMYGFLTQLPGAEALKTVISIRSNPATEKAIIAKLAEDKNNLDFIKKFFPEYITDK